MQKSRYAQRKCFKWHTSPEEVQKNVEEKKTG